METKLLCTLEELYKGSVRKMKISRNLADPSGNTLPVEEILTIEVEEKDQSDFPRERE